MSKSMLLGGLLAAILGTAAQARADETYELKKGDVKATVGAKATTSLTIAAKTGWHVNEEAPVSLKLQPDPGITIDKPKLGRGDLAQSTKEQARFDVAFTATEPGKKVINGEASFVMCQASTCKPCKEKVAFAVEAVAPAKKK
jgi:opacity protein-like surface antigen